MYCTTCGVNVREGSGFCSACGGQVGGAAAPRVAAQVAVPPQVAAQPKSGRGGRKAVVVIATLLVVAAVGLGVGYWMWTSPPAFEPGTVETIVIRGAE